MNQRIVILPVILLISQCRFLSAQEKFDLTVPGTVVKSSAELTATSLTITHEGKVSVYARDTSQDATGYTAFKSDTLRQIIRWPNSGTGSMQVARVSITGPPSFSASKMQVSRAAALPGSTPTVPIGTPPTVPRGTPPTVPRGTVPAAVRTGPVDPTSSYRFTNQFQGVGQSLTADPTGIVFMSPSTLGDDQAWRFIDMGGQTYRVINVDRGGTFSLTANGPNADPTMTLTDLGSRAQLWRLTPNGTEMRLTNESLGPNWALDVATMVATANTSGQAWTLTELAARKTVGAWQQMDAATNTPQGNTVVIRKDFTFIEAAPSQPDRTGTIGLVGDRLSIIRTRGPRDEFLVTISSDRMDFRTLAGIPTGFYLRRVPVDGVWQEINSTTNLPVGINVFIRPDLDFYQNQPSQPVLSGRVEYVGGRFSVVHNSRTREEFLTTVTNNRIDFRDTTGRPRWFLLAARSDCRFLAGNGNCHQSARRHYHRHPQRPAIPTDTNWTTGANWIRGSLREPTGDVSQRWSPRRVLGCGEREPGRLPGPDRQATPIFLATHSHTSRCFRPAFGHRSSCGANSRPCASSDLA